MAPGSPPLPPPLPCLLPPMDLCPNVRQSVYEKYRNKSTPGPVYAHHESIGRQAMSTKRTSSSWKFGSAPRDGPASTCMILCVYCLCAGAGPLCPWMPVERLPRLKGLPIRARVSYNVVYCHWIYQMRPRRPRSRDPGEPRACNLALVPMSSSSCPPIKLISFMSVY